MFHINLGTVSSPRKLLTICFDGEKGQFVISLPSMQGSGKHSTYAEQKANCFLYTVVGCRTCAYRDSVNVIALGWITVENYFKAIPGFKESGTETARNAIPPRAVNPQISHVWQYFVLDDSSISLDRRSSRWWNDGVDVVVRDFRKESANWFGAGYLPD